MVQQYRKFGLITASELAEVADVGEEIAVIPDGNTRIKESNDPYDNAGKNVFKFLKHINSALFYILSEKNIENRNEVFFKELRQSFLVLKLGILQGKVWGNGVQIELDISDEDAFVEGENSQIKSQLLAEIKDVVRLNDEMATNSGVALQKKVTLNFGAADKELAGIRRVVRTGSDGSHRFSSMIEARESFLSVTTETAFGALSEDEIQSLTVRAQTAKMDIAPAALSNADVIKAIIGIDEESLQGEKIHLTIACEDQSDASIDEIRKAIGDRAIRVIAESETLGDSSEESLVIQLTSLDKMDFSEFEATLLGEQKGRDSMVIPASKPGESRFYPAGSPEETGAELLGAISKLETTANLEGKSREDDRKFDPRFCEVIDTAGRAMQNIVNEFRTEGFELLIESQEGDKPGQISKDEISNEFTLNGKVSLKSMSGYMIHASFIGQADRIAPSATLAVARYIMCTYSIDQIFDCDHYSQNDRATIFSFLTKDTPLPPEILGRENIIRVKKLIESSRKDVSDHCSTQWEKYLLLLIKRMAEERDLQFESIEDYLLQCSPTVGAGLIIITLASRILEEDVKIEELLSDELITGINRFARLLNDLNTANTEISGPNGLNILDGDHQKLMLHITDEKTALDRLLDQMENSTLKSAIKRLLYMGQEIYLSPNGYIELDPEAIKSIIRNYAE